MRVCGASLDDDGIIRLRDSVHIYRSEKKKKCSQTANIFCVGYKQLVRVMDEIILGRLSASVIRYIGDVLAEPHEGSYRMSEKAQQDVEEGGVSYRAANAVGLSPGSGRGISAEVDSDASVTGVSSVTPTAIDELMETLTGDVVGYISYRLNAAIDREPPRIVDVDVIQNLARDVIKRTGADVSRADKGREFADKCIEAYVFVGEIEAWLKRNVTAKNKDVLTSIANLKAILQAA